MIKRVLLLCFMVPCLAFGQVSKDSTSVNNLIKGISNSLNTYATNHPAEKAYLHFDKPYYAIGDTIYFKAYVTDGGRHVLSVLSSVLHVELINNQNKIIKQLKLLLTNGYAWGDFALPDSLSAKNYRVRAYTNLMLNDGSSSFFEQPIPVTGINLKGVAKDSLQEGKSSKEKPAISFFPEGGCLLNGVKLKVAFKAIAANGLGIDVKGVVIDNEDKRVAVFNSEHLGMGAFTFRPLNGKTYRAKATFADGSECTVNLPMATNTGYALTIDTVPDEAITVAITLHNGDNVKPKGALILVAQSGGVIYSAAKSNPNSKEFIASFPKKFFPAGIAQFTLFSADGEPLNERLIFLQNADQLKLDINTVKKNYTTREKIKINLVAKNKLDMPATGTFSVAVTDETIVPVDETTENTILTNLLLTSEVKGNIENPNYYFTNQNDNTRADLDLLMLTQGYRRFEWKKILNNGYPAITYQAEKPGLRLAGYIKNGKAVIPNGKIRLLSKSAGGMVLDTTADANGRFVFDNLMFTDTAKFIIQARTAKGQKDVEIEMDKITDTINVPVVQSLNITPGNLGNLYAYSKSAKLFYDEQEKFGINRHVQQLKEVVVRDKEIAKELENSENLNGKGQADQVLTAKDFENFACGRIMDCLGSKLNSITVQFGKLYSGHSKGRPYYDEELKRTTDPPMTVVIDGTRSDYEALHALNINDVDAFEIILGTHGGAIYGTFGVNGVIVVTTKRARKINNYYKEAPGVIVYTASGFYKAREFYSPQYDNAHTNQKMTDLRSTIYWNPNIITDKDGKASFEYFNADGKGTYRVVVEGIDAEGNLGRQVFRYKVE